MRSKAQASLSSETQGHGNGRPSSGNDRHSIGLADLRLGNALLSNGMALDGRAAA
jgi:hypothetical protein